MISLVYGLPGYGKSLFIHDWIRSDPGRRYFVVEHSNEWAKGAAHWRRAAPAVYDIWDPRKLPNPLPSHGVFRCIGLQGWDVCRLAIACGPSVYVDDELDLAGRQQTWMKEGNPLPHLVHRGRHLPNARGEICEVHLIGASRRPQNLATDLTDLSDQIYVFRVQGNRTRQRLEADSTIESEDWEEARTQEKFHFIHSPSGKRGAIEPL